MVKEQHAQRAARFCEIGFVRARNRLTMRNEITSNEPVFESDLRKQLA